MNEYTIMIEGYKKVFAKNEKEAFDFKLELACIPMYDV